MDKLDYIDPIHRAPIYLGGSLQTPTPYSDKLYTGGKKLIVYTFAVMLSLKLDSDMVN